MTSHALSASKRVYRGQDSATRADERGQRLKEAGLALFGTRGYASTTIEALCSEAKVTARHFYELFPNREALLMAVYNDILQDLSAGVLQAVLSNHASMDEQIELGVKAMVKHYLKDRRRARVGVLEVVGVSETVERARRHAINTMAGLFEQFMAQRAALGELPQRNHHLLCVALVGGLNELLADWLMAEKPLSIPKLSAEVGEILRLVMKGLR
ncbi:TetR/AcrR family transcriptional regulator [Limnobacter humi]|uniref:TetR/AcrR family transcriptional regulator n=1 Tax=Limnobacter humi TaxID=1778671 RepID=A0ABT1WGF7_9BURK|nr:TetR/AcrR family transcriptional regulator [Limnobacter humi]MCQ8896606.1 TetR/AcrR family transcriptional regulator [Limnobacter humi]